MFSFLRRHLWFAVSCLILILAAVIVLRLFSYHRIDFSPVSLIESREEIKTPYCGFYHLYGYTLSEDGTGEAVMWCHNMLKNDTQSIVLLEINLRNYSGQELTEKALGQLGAIFSAFSASGKQIILRFLYDWDGKAPETEPDSRQLIQTHMKQTASVVNRYSSHIFLMQGVFTGDCGEMHNTKYGTNEDIAVLMNTLAEAVSPDIFLSVRTPQHLRTIVGTASPVSHSEKYNGTLKSRLGLYNDGMLGNEFDCGTYGDTSFAESHDHTQKGTRQEELGFQNLLCQYVPNGGEAVLDNPYNDLNAAVSDLSRMHVSYLSCDHDGDVLAKWKRSVYAGKTEDGFNGVSGYSYIAAHLGYRFVIRDMNFICTEGLRPTVTPGIVIENVGFSAAYRKFDFNIVLRNNDSGREMSFPLDVDTRTILPGTTCQIAASTPSLPKGSYSVVLSMTDPATGLPVPFANTGIEADGKFTCGQLAVS